MNFFIFKNHNKTYNKYYQGLFKDFLSDILDCMTELLSRGFGFSVFYPFDGREF